MKPVEMHLYEFLTEQIAAVQPGGLLYDLELHDTIYQTIQTVRGVRISDAVSDLVQRSKIGRAHV